MSQQEEFLAFIARLCLVLIFPFSTLNKVFDYQAAMDQAAHGWIPLPAPMPANELAKLPVKVQRWLARKGAFEFRHVHPRNELKPEKRPPNQQVWFRLIDRAPDDPALHRALLAYASDFYLLGTALQPHGISYLHKHVQVASLDHALWFHRPFRADEWFLYDCSSPSASGARGLATGQMFTVDGLHIATAVQEGLLRRVGG